MQQTRRAFLAAVAGGLTALAGCAGSPQSGSQPSTRTTTAAATSEGTTSTTATGTGPPTAASSRHVAYERGSLTANVKNGGVPKDGIPSIDDPKFGSPDDVDVPGGDPVFGVVRNGDVRAYPQGILAHHEIVNDTVGGDPVAVTYCPLTGTAQGFERGETTFGVSGDLLNANLVMYDRGTDTRWPQMLATAIEGPHTGETLQEFRVVWTTWAKWQAAYPETKVLIEDTGYLRQYDRDPYGDYNPKRGYYESENFLFGPLSEDDRDHPKAVVVGARTDSEAVAFDKQTLLDEGVLTAESNGEAFVAVADRDLDTGYVYRNPDGSDVTEAEDGYRVDGDVHDADALPLNRVLAFDAMWFAWAGYYPETAYVQ